MPPGLHALIVGVSSYPHLPGRDEPPGPNAYGMGQLTGAALAAAAMEDWLRATDGRLTVPVRSVKTLLSPSAEELRIRPSLREAPLATFAALRQAALDWQKECAADPDGVALFYFAGHGVQRTRENQVLLLRDFAADAGDPLSYGVDLSNLVNGMAPTATNPRIARTQLWFVDACRSFPSAFDEYETLTAGTMLTTTLSDRDDRCAPIYFAALPGGSAYGIPGEGTVFSRALIECLEGAAGQKLGNANWSVTVGSLIAALQEVVDADPDAGLQQVWSGGQVARPGTTIVELDRVPDVQVRLELAPPARANGISLRVSGPGGDVPVPAPLQPNPLLTSWPAGIYSFGADPPHDSIGHEQLAVMPPVFPWRKEI